MDVAVAALREAKRSGDEAKARELSERVLLRLFFRAQACGVAISPPGIRPRRTVAKGGSLFVEGRQEEALRYLKEEFGFIRPSNPEKVVHQARKFIRRLVHKSGEDVLLPEGLFDDWIGIVIDVV